MLSAIAALALIGAPADQEFEGLLLDVPAGLKDDGLGKARQNRVPRHGVSSNLCKALSQKQEKDGITVGKSISSFTPAQWQARSESCPSWRARTSPMNDGSSA